MANRLSDKFYPLDQRNLSDRIVSHIKSLIINNELKPGQRLPTENELSNLLQVSRATVREAKKVLEAAGLIEVKAGDGSYVTERGTQILAISNTFHIHNRELTIKEFFEGRKIIEVALTELAAQRSTDADIEKIEAFFSEMENSINDLDLFVESDIKFHLAVIASSHNSFLLEMYQKVTDILEKIIRSIVQLPMVRERALLMHRKIVESIKMKDPERARKASLDHLEDVWNSIKISLQIEE